MAVNISGAPTSKTPGSIGDHLVDSTTGKVYECISVNTYGGHDAVTFKRKKTEYVWKCIGDDPNYGRNTGSGLPTGGTPYQQLVTDGEGGAKWEDRLAYETEPVLTEIVPEETVSFTNDSGVMVALWPPTFNAVKGQTYIVKFDGADYTCTCIRLGGEGAPLVLGNLSLLKVGDDTGEPFVMFYNMQWMSASSDSATEHTISISDKQVSISKIDKKYLPMATNIIPGIAKIQVRNLDTTKSYSTEEIEEIFQSIRSGAAVYLANGNVITRVSYSKNEDFRYTLFNGTEITIRPVDGVWSFTNYETTYQYSVLFRSKYSDYADIGCTAFDGVGGNKGSGYELVNTNMAGFGGDYIEAENALVLKLENNPKYLYIKAKTNGEIEVTKRNIGLTAGGDTTTLFKNGDDSMILKSSTSGSSKKFKITVDDSGTISATEVT